MMARQGGPACSRRLKDLVEDFAKVASAEGAGKQAGSGACGYHGEKWEGN
jgi:accessory colonization factor AcfC